MGSLIGENWERKGKVSERRRIGMGTKDEEEEGKVKWEKTRGKILGVREREGKIK